MLAIVNDIWPPDNPPLNHSALQGDAGDSEFGTQNPDPEGIAPKAVFVEAVKETLVDDLHVTNPSLPFRNAPGFAKGKRRRPHERQILLRAA